MTLGERLRERRERDARIVYLYTDPMMSLRDIAKEVGISFQRVSIILKREGVDVRKPGYRHESMDLNY